jgi:hypothetical protein
MNPKPGADQSAADPTARDQCRLLDLLGRINYRILSGNRVYIEVEGVVYKTIYGGLLAQRFHRHRALPAAL